MVLLAFGMKLMAGPVDMETAKQLGGKFMQANQRSTSAMTLAYTEITDSGLNVCYVFNCQPKGFVIVAADDRMKPILGYSTKRNFSSVIPEGLMTFFDNYRVGFEQMVANNDPRVDRAVADWNSVAETGRLVVPKRERVVEPLLSSIWNQTDLYNNMCPEDPSSIFGGRCKAGCVANAMCQIMRYWEWPRTGTGSHGYNAGGYYGSYGWQEANFAEATYQFELMPDFLDFASPQYEVDAVALLEYHAGVSVEMGYGPSASGAFSEDVGPALVNYFRYAPDYDYHYEDGYDEWRAELRDNLDAGMPLYYAASGDAGGHAFVCDGYDNNDMFHFNWGWAGFDNGYYDVEAFYLTYYSFPWFHNAVFNLHPNNEYYNAPKPVAFEIDDSEAINRHVELWIRPNFLTRNDDPIDVLDSVVIMRDGVVIRSFDHVAQDELLYPDELDKNGTYYYAVYAVNSAGKSEVARDTITVGSTCDMRFELADSGGNGWDMSFIAILDEDGKVSHRVGLWDGGEASITVPVPSNQTATLFWTYDNTCYSHGLLSEVSYEIYDWDDNLIVSSNGYPEVGVIMNYEIDCDVTAVQDYSFKALLYPNPASEHFTVDGNIKEIKVFNALGQLVHQGTDPVVEVKAWPVGMYFVLVLGEDGAVSTVKFVKQN
jgi:hypothetical protein